MPIIVLLLFVVLLMRQMQGKGANFNEMKQVSTRPSTTERRRARFHDLIGAEETATAAHVMIDALLEAKQKKGARRRAS